jgi:hypothetical protein
MKMKIYTHTHSYIHTGVCNQISRLRECSGYHRIEASSANEPWSQHTGGALVQTWGPQLLIRNALVQTMRILGDVVYSFIQIYVNTLISGESIHSRILINITLIHTYQLQCTPTSFPWLGLVQCVCVTVCLCVCVCVWVLNISECESSCYTGRDWASFVNSGPQNWPSVDHQVLFLLMSKRKNP